MNPALAEDRKRNGLVPAQQTPAAQARRPSVLKSIREFALRTTGLDAKRMFADALVTNAGRLLDRRLGNVRQRGLLEQEDLRSHYADIEVMDQGTRNVLLSFITARVSFIEDCLGLEEIARSSFVDVGDSSGIFLRALGKRGVGVNSSAGVARSIAAKGAAAIRGDAMRLPMQDGACDYALCFETLEHLPNPFGGFLELSRVCRKGAFISVPHVSRTNVYPARFRDAPQELLHIFELSRSHWDALLTHTPFKIERTDVVPVVEAPRGMKETIAFGLWRVLFGQDVFFGHFKNFLLYRLTKR